MKIRKTGAILAASAAILLTTAGCQSTGTSDSDRATAKMRSGCRKAGCNMHRTHHKSVSAKEKVSCRSERVSCSTANQ